MSKIVCIIILINFTSLAQDSLNMDLVKRIYTIYNLDQEVRANVRKYHNNELDTSIVNLEELNKKTLEVDSANYYELKSIVEDYGFPGYNAVGKDFSDAFWNLVQHQDNNSDFQEVALDSMKVQVDKNNATKAYYAYLIDRVKVNKGELQIYGTQMQLNSDSTSYEPKPLIEPENLDARRLSVELPPIDEYIGIMNERYFGTLKRRTN